MGTGNLTDQNDGEVADAADVQQIIDSKKEDIVPRNSSGVPTANAGDLGTSTYPFKKGNITTGYFFAGMIIPYHDFNGTLSPGQGWFKCDGSIINETNYDAIHGAGSWDTYIGSSSLDGKYSPNLVSKYPVGSSVTTQSGGTAITSVGNSGHNITEANHTHTMQEHIHHTLEHTDLSTTHQIYQQGSGTATNMTSGTRAGGIGLATTTGANAVNQDFATSATVGWSGSTFDDVDGLTTGSDGGFTKSIQPESIEVQFWIRII